MNLTPNFTLEEFISSDTAARHKIDNTPAGDIEDKLRYVASRMEYIRILLDNKPITITSGYRCLALNRLIKSKDNSQHVLGEAVDFKCPSFGTPRQIIQRIIESKMSFDQLIQEYDSWVHISFKVPDNKQQKLIIDDKGTRLFS